MDCVIKQFPKNLLTKVCISGRYDELRNKTISEESFDQSLQSYFGMLKHCNGHKVEKRLYETLLAARSPQ